MMSASRLLIQPSQALRRSLIVVAYAIPLFVFGTGRYASEQYDGWTALLGVSFLILLWLIYFASRTLNIGGTQDERQRNLGMQALTVTYIVVAPLALFNALYYRYGGAGSPLLEFSLSALFYLVGFLPATVVAWLEPDPLRELGDA